MTQMTTRWRTFFKGHPKEKPKFSLQPLAKGVALNYRMLFSGNITWVSEHGNPQAFFCRGYNPILLESLTFVFKALGSFGDPASF